MPGKKGRRDNGGYKIPVGLKLTCPSLPGPDKARHLSMAARKKASVNPTLPVGKQLMAFFARDYFVSF